MSNYLKQPLPTTSTLEQFLIGHEQGKSTILSLPLELNTTNSQIEKLQAKRLLAMYVFLAIVKSNISNPKQNFSYLNILLLKLFLKLLTVLTLGEKSCGILWNPQLQEMSAVLWSHIKTDSLDSDLSLFKESLNDLTVKSWFSTKSLPVLKKNSSKTFCLLSTSSVRDSMDLENIKTNSKVYRLKADKNQRKLIQSWMKICKKVFNEAIEILNTHQGFSHLGIAKGTKEQQFQTVSMRTWLKNNNYGIPAKLLHNTLHRAYRSWVNTKPDKKTKLKTAKLATGWFTLETDPKALAKGKLYPKFWGKNEPLIFRYNHCDVSLLQGTCLLIYMSYGRLYCAQPNKVEYANRNSSDKVIALDPGIRNFITGFDGHNGYQFTDSKDLERLAKLKAYRAKLHKNLKGKSQEHQRKIKQKMARINRKVINLTKDLHRKIAAWLSKNYRVIFVPSYRVKTIYAKGKQNKTNRKNQLNWSWYKFRQTLEYHCAKNGSVVIEVSEAYTSKTCSKCGHVHSKLGSNKIFDCPHCHHRLDRDLNGAINIFFNSLVIQGGLG